VIDKFRQLARSSLTYGAGNYGVKLVGFFLIPVYTRYLLPADYGILALVSAFNRILFILLNVGQSTALFRFYYDHDEPEARARVIAASLWVVLLYSLPLALVMLALSHVIASTLLGDGALYPLVAIGVLTMGSRVVLRLPFSVMRAQRRDTAYASWNLTRTALSAGLAILFVVGLEMGVRGVLLSALAAEVVLLTCLVSIVIKTLRIGWTPEQTQAQLWFGLALVPAGLSAFIMDLSDRLFLRWYATMDDVGLYSLGYRFGEIIFFVVTAIQLAWPQFVFGNRKLKEAPRLYAYASTYYVAGLLFLVLGLSLLAPEVIAVMTTPAFQGAAVVVPIVAMAGLCQGICSIGSIGIMFQKRPIVRAYAIATAAVLNLGLNYLLIPRYGMLGAAWATVLSFIVQATLLVWAALRYYPVPYQWGRFTQLFITAAVVYGLGWLLPHAPVVITLAMKALVLAAFPAALWVLGFFEPAELRQVQQLGTSIIHRLRPARG